MHNNSYRLRDRRGHWFALILAVGLSSSAVLSCSDDTADTSENDAGAAGNASGGSTGGAHAGSHTGGQPPEDSDAAGAAGAGDSEALAIEGDRRVPYTPKSDVEFVDFFISHHQMAIEMANEEIERGDDAALVAMAGDMVDAQTAEIAMLESIRKQLTGSVPNMPEDGHSMADMTRLKAASGAELDRLFLLDMIPHHAAALAPAHRALPYLETSALKVLAQSIVLDQSTEIGEMHAMLAEVGAVPAGTDAASDGTTRADFGLVGDRRIPLTPADDVEFIDFFVPHHRMAVEMVEHEIAHGADSKVVMMAKMMRDAQTEEITLMTQKRTELAGTAEPSPASPDPHAMSEMAEMMKMSGAELDQMFLSEMIVHHASALPTAHRAKPHVEDAALGELADAMYEAQAKEIGEMRMMLNE